MLGNTSGGTYFMKYVPPDVFPSISNYIIDVEDVYVSIAGSIGKVGVIPQSLSGANLTENAAKLVLKEGIYNR